MPHFIRITLHRKIFLFYDSDCWVQALMCRHFAETEWFSANWCRTRGSRTPTRVDTLGNRDSKMENRFPKWTNISAGQRSSWEDRKPSVWVVGKCTESEWMRCLICLRLGYLVSNRGTGCRKKYDFMAGDYATCGRNSSSGNLIIICEIRSESKT